MTTLVVAALGLALALPAPTPATPPSMVGSNGHYVLELGEGLYTRHDVVRELNLVRDFAGELIRTGVPWQRFEPRRDVAWDDEDGYNHRPLSDLDFIVQEAHKRDLRVLLTVMGSPCWASSAPKLLGVCITPSFWRYAPNVAEYGEFVRFLTDRYGSKLAGIEIWNAPNYGASSLLGRAPIWHYANMVKQAFQQRERGVQIYAGALHRGSALFPATLWTTWMDAIWPTINDHYDVWSVHDYADRAARTIAQHDRLQAKEGAEPVEIAVTEFGACTWGCRSPVSESVQAQRITNQLEAMGALGYVSEAYQFETRDSPDRRPTIYANGFGLVRVDWTKKPSYDTLADYLAP